MQKISIFFFILLLSVALESFSQHARPKNFFVGKWEISVADTPEIKFITDLVRKKGRLTGELADAKNPSSPKLPITKVEEKGSNISIYYTSGQSKEMVIDLTKVDADNLKGTMYTFDASAKRIK